MAHRDVRITSNYIGNPAVRLSFLLLLTLKDTSAASIMADESESSPHVILLPEL